RPLHPELFDVLTTRRLRAVGGELTLRVTPGGHVVSWDDGRAHLTEVIADPSLELPAKGLLLRRRLRGEHTAGVSSLPGVSYQAGFQVEKMRPDVFVHVHGELIADGGRHGLLHLFAPHHRLARSPLAAVAVEAWNGGLSLSAFHTFPGESAVVKTQTLIERRK